MSTEYAFRPPFSRVVIVAEAGVNHNGDVGTAKKLCDLALECKCDAVKFQTWKPGEVTGRFAVKVQYIKETSGDESRYDLSRRLCLPYDAFREIKAHCDRIGITFLSTPDGFESLAFLVDELDVPAIKVASTEITHPAYIEDVAKRHRPTLLSTGMSTLGEVEACVEIFRRHGHDALTLLHCTSQYPAFHAEVNLRAMVTMRNAFQVPVGFSDHTVGSQASIAAVALGAQVIEKHFTLDKNMPGPDHRASASQDELAELVRSIRIAEAVLGDGVKRPTASERENIPGVRRGVVAARALAKGTVLKASMLTAKRPFTGILPAQSGLLVGRTLQRDLEEDEPVRWEDVA